MNSTSMKIKKFLSNRNTVTIICAIIGIIVLYVGYTMKVQSAIEPVSVPYAKVTIQPRTKITDDMIGYMNVASAALDEMGDNVILDTKKIIEYYSNINTMIPKGSMFYEGAVVAKDTLPDAAVYDVPDGEVLYYLTVNMSTSYVNAIVPGGYIDLYVRDTDNYGKARVGKFIKNIKVLAVKTSDGLNVFENSDEKRVPAYVIFSIPAEQHNYLVTASQLGINVFPVPTSVNQSEVEVGASVITSEDVMVYIEQTSKRFEQNLEIIINNGQTNQNNQNTNNQTNGG